VLLAPSVVARCEWNATVNPAPPDAAYIVVIAPQAVIPDARLFTGAVVLAE
jgi:RES domain-containing protein